MSQLSPIGSHSNSVAYSMGRVASFVLVAICVSRNGFAAKDAQFEADKKSFIECMHEYKKYPREQVIAESMATEQVIKNFDSIDVRLLDALDEAPLKIRYQQFNSKFLLLRNLLKKQEQKFKEVAAKRDSLPLTTKSSERMEYETRAKALEDVCTQARYKVLATSLACNDSVVELVAHIPPEKLVALKTAGIERPKMPGRYGGSVAERERMSAAEKINLTPVDPEFYQTQLGKKLFKDLGGNVQFWSYDYQKDDLYVMVNNEIGKISVVAGNDGYRYMTTQVGKGYKERRAPDVKVDMVKAEGSFLTGDKNQETLFGKMPDKKPVFVDENPSHSSGGSGQNEHDSK